MKQRDNFKMIIYIIFGLIALVHTLFFLFLGEYLITLGYGAITALFMYYYKDEESKCINHRLIPIESIKSRGKTVHTKLYCANCGTLISIKEEEKNA